MLYQNVACSRLVVCNYLTHVSGMIYAEEFSFTNELQKKFLQLLCSLELFTSNAIISFNFWILVLFQLYLNFKYTGNTYAAVVTHPKTLLRTPPLFFKERGYLTVIVPMLVLEKVSIASCYIMQLSICWLPHFNLQLLLVRDHLPSLQFQR